MRKNYEPEQFHECFICGKHIHMGDDYRQLGEDYAHDHCMKNALRKGDLDYILENWFDVALETAGETIKIKSA